MNEINITALAADVLLRLLFYTTFQAGVYGAVFYLVGRRLLRQMRKK